MVEIIKIYRYQQFRAVNKAIKSLQEGKDSLSRGGVVWHTQGSGKSLTMVMLARKIKRTKEIVSSRIKYYQRFFNIQPTNIKIKEQKKRWGSCTSKNELLFNWRCIMAKSNVLDYIVVHEMCHMYYKDHSKEFWQLVCSVLPDYEIRKEWLKNYGVRMDL